MRHQHRNISSSFADHWTLCQHHINKFLFELTPPPTHTTQRPAARKFGAHAEVKYEGFEAKVRQVLPKDEHVVMGILAMYGVLIVVGKAATGGGEKKEEAAPVAVASTSGDIPSVDSEAFGSFIESESNLNKLIDSWSK